MPDHSFSGLFECMVRSLKGINHVPIRLRKLSSSWSTGDHHNAQMRSASVTSGRADAASLRTQSKLPVNPTRLNWALRFRKRSTGQRTPLNLAV